MLYLEDGDLDVRFNLSFYKDNGFVRNYCTDNLSILTVTLNFNKNDNKEFSRRIPLLFSCGYTHFKSQTGLLFEYVNLHRYTIDGMETVKLNFIRGNNV